MMNHLTDTKIAWDNLICKHIHLKRPQRVLGGVPNNFVEKLRVCVVRTARKKFPPLKVHNTKTTSRIC